MGTTDPAKKPKDDNQPDMNLSCKPQPILAEELTQQPPLEKAFIGVLKDKRGISKAIAGLGGWLPSPQFLKRCYGLKIYLAPEDKVDGKPEDLKQLLLQNKFDLTLLEDEFEVAEVPSVAPRTKAQMAYAIKFWPMNFHPDLKLEALISGSMFNDAQLVALAACMRIAISAADGTAVGSKDCNGSAVIIDLEEGSILAVAASSVDQHPMWHASMLAVDLVAKIQGGGAWKLIPNTKDQQDTTKRKHPDDLPLCYPDSLSRIDVPKDLIFTNKDEKKEPKESKKEPSDKCGPYLCTGYWAVLLQEPCPLCAMALLHSRVYRIFYGAANSRTGILGSRATLHSVPGLNHRYQVWSGVLEDECVKTVEKLKTIDD